MSISTANLKKGSRILTKANTTTDVVASDIYTGKTIGIATLPSPPTLTPKVGLAVLLPGVVEVARMKIRYPPNHPKRKRGRARVHHIIMKHPKRWWGRPRKIPQDI